MERIEKPAADFSLVLVLTLLIALGLSMLYSASYYYAERVFADARYFLKRQAFWVLLGGIIAVTLSRISLLLLRKLAPIVLLFSLALALMTFIPGVGIPVLGARRWIFIFGQSFEPSELMKFSLVLYLAAIFSKKRDRINDPINSVLPPLIIVAVFVGLIYFQNDFSTATFVLFVALSMFFVARVRLIYFFQLGLLGIPLGVLLLFTKAHRVKRLMAFLNPLADPMGSGFQVIAAQTALTGGGFWGRGLGKGLKKLGALPEAHSDFIFAVIGEEAGFLGALFVLALFLFLAWRGYRVAIKSEDHFVYYLAFGITTLLVLQAILNIAVVVGLVPATGVTLPFFSHGGSSMLVSLIMCGLLINLSRQIPVDRSSYV